MDTIKRRVAAVDFELPVLTPEEAKLVARFQHELSVLSAPWTGMDWVVAFVRDGTPEEVQQQVRKIQYEQRFMNAVLDEAERVINPLTDDFKKMCRLLGYAYATGRQSVLACEEDGDRPEPMHASDYDDYDDEEDNADADS